MSEGLLIGTSIYPADGEAGRRQETAMRRLRDISRWPLLNLQFEDGRNLREFDGFETAPVLAEDSIRVSGRAGRRKPVITELFTRLAESAAGRGLRYFVFTNSDILFTAEAVERVLAGDHTAFVFTRTDVEPVTGRDLQPLIYGADAFAVDARWWLSHRQQFRPYIVGEPAWDNVIAAQLLCWTDGLLLNREPLVRHETHPIVWIASPFSDHNGHLAALDRMYFTRWARYVRDLETLRAAAGGLAPLDAELQLQHRAFRDWRPGIADHVLQALRMAKLRLRKAVAAPRRDRQGR